MSWLNRIACAALLCFTVTFSGSAAPQQGSIQSDNSATSQSGPVAPAPPAAVVLVPPLMRFNGALQDAVGKPLTGAVDVTFSIYKDQNDGDPLWQETQTVRADLHGHYTVLLGVTQELGLPMELFQSGEARWLGVSVGDVPEQPRILLASVPYAFKAGDAEMLGGKPASAYALAQGGNYTSGEGAPPTSKGPILSTRGNGKAGDATSTGKTSSSPKGFLTTSGTANYVPVFSDPTTLVNSDIFDTAGAVGVLTSTPANTFDIRGGLREAPGQLASNNGEFVVMRADQDTVHSIYYEEGSQVHLRLSRAAPLPGQSPLTQHLMITPYTYGMNIEYPGVLQLATGVTEILSNPTGRQARLWIGDETDSGGLCTTVHNSGSPSTSFSLLAVEPYGYGGCLSSGDFGSMLFRVGSTVDSFQFQTGTDAAPRTNLAVWGTGDVSIGNASDLAMLSVGSSGQFQVSSTGALTGPSGTFSGATGGPLLQVTQNGSGAGELAISAGYMGIWGQTTNTSGTGVRGEATAATGGSVGVFGVARSSSGVAGRFDNTVGGTILSGTVDGNPRFSVDGSGNVSATGQVTGSQLVSTASSGVSPLVVKSTTQVPNLNASLLGGMPASAFASLSTANTFTGPLTVSNLLATTGLTTGNLPSQYGQAAILPDNLDSVHSMIGQAGTQMHFRLSRGTPDISGATDLLIAPYNYGMAVEYPGVLEFWTSDFSVHTNQTRDINRAANFWIGDEIDSGGLYSTARNNGGGTNSYVLLAADRFDHTSHGSLLFQVRNPTDTFKFQSGPWGSGATKTQISTTTLATNLDVYSGSVQGTLRADSGANAVVLGSSSNSPLGFFTGGSGLQATLFPDGNFSIGNSLDQATLSVGSAGQFQVSSGGTVTFAAGQTFPGTMSALTAGNFARVDQANSFSGDQSVAGNVSASGALAASSGTFSGSTGVGVPLQVVQPAGDGVGELTTSAGYMGIWGKTTNTSGTGVRGEATATTGASVGVFGVARSPSAIAGRFDNTAGGTILSGFKNGNPRFSVDGSGNVSATGQVTGSQLVSTASSGVPPLVVSSTTQVPNLNASLLGGLPASAFAAYTAGTGSWGSGSPFAWQFKDGSTAPPTVGFNGTGGMGVGTSTPGNTLDVRGGLREAPGQLASNNGEFVVMRADQDTVHSIFGQEGTQTHLRLSRATPVPGQLASTQHLMITPYNYGMNIEYPAVLQLATGATEILSNPSGRQVQFWVGDEHDAGGLCTTVHNSGSPATSFASLAMTAYPPSGCTGGADFGSMLFQVVGSTDKFQFQTGTKSPTPDLTIWGTGDVSIGNASDLAMLSVGPSGQFQVSSTGALTGTSGTFSGSTGVPVLAVTQNGSAEGELAISAGFMGIWGQTTSTSGTGVRGEATATTGQTVGVFGVARSPSGIAGRFDNTVGGTILSGTVDGGQRFSVDGYGNVTATGSVSATSAGLSGALTIGGGTPIVQHLSATAALSFPPFASQSCNQATISVAGAADGNTVALGIPNALASLAGVTWFGWVSASGQVTVRGCNATSSATAASPPATVRADVWKH